MSDSDSTVDSLKAIVRGFCDERDWARFHNPKDLAIGMVTEASELLDLFRFKDAGDVDAMMSDPDRSLAVRDELADVLYFVLRFADMNGIDLSTELRRKVAIDAEKYPADVCRGRNLKYTELRRASHGNKRNVTVQNIQYMSIQISYDAWTMLQGRPMYGLRDGETEGPTRGSEGCGCTST